MGTFRLTGTISLGNNPCYNVDYKISEDCQKVSYTVYCNGDYIGSNSPHS